MQDGFKGQLRAITLSRDHLSIYPQERQRIEKSGGFVSKVRIAVGFQYYCGTQSDVING
jgi:hypothetical protein